LDAEYELANPRGYTPSRAARERVRAYAVRALGLLQPGDIVLDAQNDTPQQCAGNYAGKTWCPTPRALARLAAAGIAPPDAPVLSVLQRVNDRRFGIEHDPGPLQTQYITEVAPALALLRQASATGRWLMKRAFGLAGRGHRRVDGAPGEDDVRWLINSFADGHGVAVEPWVEREADFAIHGLCGRDGQVRLGRELMQRCDARGTWQETLLVPQGGLEPSEREALRQSASAVGNALHVAGYFGPFGVDSFRFRERSGRRCFQPLVEINARYCMGWPLSGLSS
jgi:hypothetical protein